MQINRRHMMKLTGGSVASIITLPSFALGETLSIEDEIYSLFGNRDVKSGRVKLKLPPLAENGYLVSLEVEAESPMTEDDYVRRIAIFSDRNPIPLIGSFNFTPHSGRARFASKIRLGGTQHVHAIAEMSDGQLFGSSSKIFVTLAACIVL